MTKKKSQGRKGRLRPSQKGLELLAKAFGCSPTGPGEQLWRRNQKPYFKNKIEFLESVPEGLYFNCLQF